MFKTRFTIACGVVLAVSVLGLAPSAHAVTFDFVAYAAGNEHGAVSETLANGGISVTVSGRSLDNAHTYLAYFDDLSGGAPSGLGVCESLFGGGECPDNDDNVDANEVLQLLFNVPVVINSLELSNGAHLDIYNGNFGVALNSTPTAVGDFTQYLAQAVAGSIAGFSTTFSFISNATLAGSTTDPDRIYISKIDVSPSVPEPATLALVSFAAAGALASRRRRM